MKKLTKDQQNFKAIVAALIEAAGVAKTDKNQELLDEIKGKMPTLESVKGEENEELKELVEKLQSMQINGEGENVEDGPQLGEQVETPTRPAKEPENFFHADFQRAATTEERAKLAELEAKVLSTDDQKKYDADKKSLDELKKVAEPTEEQKGKIAALEAELKALDAKVTITAEELPILHGLRYIIANSHEGEVHHMFNKRMRSYAQPCYDDGKYLFKSPTFCNGDKKTAPNVKWVATWDKKGTSVWVCGTCQSVYPRKER